LSAGISASPACDILVLSIQISPDIVADKKGQEEKRREEKRGE
jgi:hypothetical protein